MERAGEGRGTDGQWEVVRSPFLVIKRVTAGPISQTDADSDLVGDVCDTNEDR